MSLLSTPANASAPADWLGDAHAVTAEVIETIVDTLCRRFPSAGHPTKAARIERLIAAEAWTDAALALIDLELPQWQIRRIAYDEGEWHCALSRQRELPEWLDQSIEAHHAALPLAILSAFVEARLVGAPSNRASVPGVSRHADVLFEPLCSDNFA